MDLASGPKTSIIVFTYGGLFTETFNCLIRDVASISFNAGIAMAVGDCKREAWRLGCDLGQYFRDFTPWHVSIDSAPEDADIGRCRSAVVQNFLSNTDSEVLIMLDHDLDWVGPSSEYEGDLLHLARKCAESKGIVGGCVSKKTKAQGIASMFKQEGSYNIGQEGLFPAYWVGAAFTAYHRDVLKTVFDSMDVCAPGFAPSFLQCVVRHPHDDKLRLHLSEDWAFCHRARSLGLDVTYLATRPIVGHVGKHKYTVCGDAQQPSPNTSGDVQTIESPIISLIHATRGRPEQAFEAKKAWLERASGRHRIEYILSLDSDDPTGGWVGDVGEAKIVAGISRGCVDAYNRGFKASSGKIIVQVHDDLVPSQNWDELIINKLGNLDEAKVLKVGGADGINPDKPWLIWEAIGTRKFFERLGGMYHPGYVSVFCDDDLSLFAKKLGCVVEASEIKFDHAWKGQQGDDTYKRSYSSANWDGGKQLFQKRIELGEICAQ